jgi:2-oxoacid:acceptor oxidoreductase gamma subunit (pyruvate/2-ketoisovalerate family)
MVEIVFYGRGGQGAVTAAQILAQAAFLDGLYAQAFPKFGIERRGAPVSAFLRIGEEPIEHRGTFKVADFAIVTDVMSVTPDALFSGLRHSGTAIINSPLNVTRLRDFARRVNRDDVRLVSVDATNISVKVFGETAIPITSVAMVGAFAATSGLVGLDSINRALTEFFQSSLAEKNFRAASAAFESVTRGSPRG